MGKTPNSGSGLCWQSCGGTDLLTPASDCPGVNPGGWGAIWQLLSQTRVPSDSTIPHPGPYLQICKLIYMVTVALSVRAKRKSFCRVQLLVTLWTKALQRYWPPKSPKAWLALLNSQATLRRQQRVLSPWNQRTEPAGKGLSRKTTCPAWKWPDRF